MSETTKYTLVHPVEVRNQAGQVTDTITELNMRRLNGRDMRAADSAKGQYSATLIFIARSSGIAPPVADLLDAEDLAAAGAIVAGFFGVSTSDEDDSSAGSGSAGAA